MKFRIHLDNCRFMPCEPLLRASDKEELQPNEANKKTGSEKHEQQEIRN